MWICERAGRVAGEYSERGAAKGVPDSCQERRVLLQCAEFCFVILQLAALWGLTLSGGLLGWLLRSCGVAGSRLAFRWRGFTFLLQLRRRRLKGWRLSAKGTGKAVDRFDQKPPGPVLVRHASSGAVSTM